MYRQCHNAKNHKKRTEKSCINLVIISSDLNSDFKSLHIDEERKHILTKIQKKKNGNLVKESDHNILHSEFVNTVPYKTDKNKIEVYNIKNTVCQEKFKEYTTNTKMLSSIFDAKEDINIHTQRFVKKLHGCIKKNFKRVRIDSNKTCEKEELYTRMRELKAKDDIASRRELKEVIDKIAKNADNKYHIVIEELNRRKPEGEKINSQKFWQLNKKLNPKNKSSHFAIFSSKGNLLTSSKELK